MWEGWPSIISIFDSAHSDDRPSQVGGIKDISCDRRPELLQLSPPPERAILATPIAMSYRALFSFVGDPQQSQLSVAFGDVVSVCSPIIPRDRPTMIIDL